jgi:hypothetical protein
MINKKNDNKKKVLYLILLTFLVIVCFVRVLLGYFPMSQGIRRLLYVFTDNIGYQTPIVEEKFPVNKAGYQKTYNLDFQYIDIYTIGLLIKGQALPETYHYTGKIKADFYYDGKKIFTKISDASSIDYLTEDDMSHTPWLLLIREIRLVDFEVLQGYKFYKKMSVTITVLEADENLTQYEDQVVLYIGIVQTL